MNMKKFILLLPFITFFAACATVNQAGVDDLKKEVAKLQIKCSNLELRQAEVYSKYEENMVNAETTNASVQELYKKMSNLSQQVKDLEVLVKKQKNNSHSTKSSDVEVPSKIYENAYNDFLLGKYEIAMVGFKSFLKQYKDHDLAVQAQYYIAESFYSQNKWTDAYEEYKKIEKEYPNSEYVSSARLKMALCLELLGKKKDSIVMLQSILNDYPKSAEAFTAKEKIKIYNTNDNKK